jgi:hypothetical protein
MDKTLDWDGARKHLVEVRAQYRDVAGVPGVNPYFALAIMADLQKRLDDGDRSVELYDEIMGLE